MNVCIVGGNPISAFLSWRLQATNACDVTLVWKSGFEHVAQYGITFKSPTFGNERFKPLHVVRSPEESSAQQEGPFDYVILCIKALPDVYDLASVIEPVVTPQHTCILINTTHALGIESAVEERFPTNVVLSLVSNAELSQLGQSEFEHKGSTEIWVGPANGNDNIPPTIQEDMAQALAMTLSTGQVDCKVSGNIRQQQYERMIGPISFHPASVIFETHNHSQLLEKPGVRGLVLGLIDELLALAAAHGCKLDSNFKQRTVDEMLRPSATESIMWQDYVAKRPMEVETFLGSPIKLARNVGVAVPRIETMYAILHNLNIVNRQKPRLDTSPVAPGSPTASPLPRISSQNGIRSMSNGMSNPNGMPPRGPRPRNSSSLGPGMRRPPPTNGGPPNGYGRPPVNGPPNGYPGPGSRAASRRGSMEANDLEEFSHLVLYDDIPEGGQPAYGQDRLDSSLHERGYNLRQREMALREHEMRIGQRRGPPPKRSNPVRHSAHAFDDDDDDDEYYDPLNAPAPPPLADPDNFDMMSVTSRKNRKVPGPSPAQLRRNTELDVGPPPARGGRFRPSFGRNRSSQMSNIPIINDNILDDPLMSCSSNRYGNVDRTAMQAGSRANSLTSVRHEELPYGPGGPSSMGMNGAYPRRTSQSPGNTYSPSLRGGRPSPPNGFSAPPMAGGPHDGVRQPVPRYPPGHGNAVAPQQVEQHAGVSGLHPHQKNVRSLTGSASASAGSGDSQMDTEPSAHSSQSSLGPRPPIGVR
ncbi:ApbA-domain-containing protein [Sodiomyces alkalinus F11]|uniref:ApbA-domain-containing protein n=1 Tax=Sodiomyces alkalinus (strain CBS 110278 / VKM F-3762 / F11) TaxID=1314773 RepID=A0A3N2PSN5_SODAK|nr:ApbA-domain-containing protein [Sodiomyces alkalinus F11]ROT37531.1 ApbA-domain-containing protein [Sodiomyces alkalinus F11]